MRRALAAGPGHMGRNRRYSSGGSGGASGNRPSPPPSEGRIKAARILRKASWLPAALAAALIGLGATSEGCATPAGGWTGLAWEPIPGLVTLQLDGDATADGHTAASLSSPIATSALSCQVGPAKCFEGARKLPSEYAAHGTTGPVTWAYQPPAGGIAAAAFWLAGPVPIYCHGDVDSWLLATVERLSDP